MQIQISWLLKKPTDLDLHCLQRQGIYPGSAGQGLRWFVLFLTSFIHILCHVNGTVSLSFFSWNALWYVFFFFLFFYGEVVDSKLTLTLVDLYHSLGKFSRRQIDYIFPRKQALTFHANRLLRRQTAWNVEVFFWKKRRKLFQNVVCWNFYPEC